VVSGGGPWGPSVVKQRSKRDCESTGSQTQTGIAGGDLSCFGGNGSGAPDRIPGALFRGGDFSSGSFAGVFAVRSDFDPWVAPHGIKFGFRCAR